MKKRIAIALLLASSSAFAQDANTDAKPASPATIAAQKQAERDLPADNGQDMDFASRGFVGTRADPIIRSKDGKPVWNLDAYAWMQGPAPATVNPSLWRHQNILRKHGLFAVADGVWQVRGFDVSNMTVIKGDKGWILVDPLTNRETGAAALELVNEKLGARPVSALIYTHSHADHFGGARGIASVDDIMSGKITVIAPEHFVEETASENVMAGTAMGRRANYQFGGSLTPGPSGQMGSGIGSGVAGGEITLLAPSDSIRKTGETRTVDGVSLEFQMVPETEAPAEMNIMIPKARTLLVGEIATCSLHNILTPRGAKVRDARGWAGYLTEAIRLYGDRADTMVASHCWPRFGNDEVRHFLTLQRDNYKYLHDQTVRLMNQGLTQAEIAEQLKPPAALANEWSSRGYYGTYSHNSKAIYQYYLGWYDANPANLNPLPPVERAKKYVAAMGGEAKVLALGKKAMADGDYRWAVDILDQLVFADPANKHGKAMLADSYEQLGYQSEASTWRNMYLSAARDLREGVKNGASTQSLDLVAAIPTALLLDSIATRLDPAKLGTMPMKFQFNIADRKETALVSVANSVMVSEMGISDPAAIQVTGPRPLLLALFFLKTPVAQLQAMGLKVDGDAAALSALQKAIDVPKGGFNIAEP